MSVGAEAFGRLGVVGQVKPEYNVSCSPNIHTPKRPCPVHFEFLRFLASRIMKSTTHFADRVNEREVGSCHLFTLRTPAEQVVSWRGSFQTNPDLAAGDDLRQEMVVSMLDKGTQHRDRFALARVLEDRGAELNLSSDGLYVDFSGRALREDVPEVLAVLAEMLREPLFDPTEFEKERAQAAAQIQRNMEDTGSQAAGALTRELYPPAHPNYSPSPEEQLAQLDALTIDDVRTYHAEHFGATGFLFAFVGDIDDSAIESAVEEHFKGWAPHGAPVRHASEAEPSVAGRTTVPMPDKQNVDVRMGHPLPVRRDDDDYLPLYVGNYILGGNFSARLMATIRDEMGLTYGVSSSLSGMSTQYDGHWQVGVTLSQDKLEHGIAATRAEVERFVGEGATEEELEAKKTTITGSYTVGLATTRRLARSLLTNAERGFEVEYLDRFPTLIEALTLEEINQAIREYFHPERFRLAMAGMLPEEETQGA